MSVDETLTVYSVKVYEEFDGKAYLDRRFSAPGGVIDEERGVQPFYLQAFHDFYQKHNKEWDATKVRLLELGGGPCIYTLISAAPYVSEIVFSDFVADSHKQVVLWKNSNPSAHDWSPYFKHVVGMLERSTDPEGPRRREEEVRSKLKSIHHCDIRAEKPEDIVEGVSGPFDIVSSNFVLEVVSESVSIYENMLRKLIALVKPGGFLVSLVSEEESWYMYKGTKKCFHLYLTGEDIKRCHANAGFIVRSTDHFPLPQRAMNVYNDCKGIFFIACQRPL